MYALSRGILGSQVRVPVVRFYSKVGTRPNVNVPKPDLRSDLKSGLKPGHVPPPSQREQQPIPHNTTPHHNQPPLHNTTSHTSHHNQTSPTTSQNQTSSPPLQPSPEYDTPKTIPEKLVASLPNAAKPYAKLSRMDKPIGTWLLYSPGTWSITMAAFATSAPPTLFVYTLALFGIGAFITRGAGCTINDLWDRKLDAQVARTMLRPLASGAVTPKQAVAWTAAQGALALGVLLLLPKECWLLTLASVLPVVLYPSFKRFTYYPQAFLSFCFTWAALVGFPAMYSYNLPAMLSLWGAAFSWCMIYDTIYAHQDKVFDISAGIKSTALKWKERTKPILNRFATAQVGLLSLSGYFVGMGPFFYLGVGAAAYRLFTMIKRVDLNNPKDCWAWFLRNIYTGHVIFLGALMDYLMRLMGMY